MNNPISIVISVALLSAALLSSALFLAGIQVGKDDLKILSGKYHYRPTPSVVTAWVCLLLICAVFIFDIAQNGFGDSLLYIAAALALEVLWQWALGHLYPKGLWATLLQFIPPAFFICIMLFNTHFVFTTFSIMGLYVRNNPFGTPALKSLLLFSRCKHRPNSVPLVIEAEATPIPHIHDFSFAGNLRGDISHGIVYNVADEGIRPNTGKDVLDDVQNLINRVGQTGGGIIYFPAGTYHFNKCSKKKNFLQINHSNITLKGEVDSLGKPLARLVNCNSTLRGKKNPWLSPFFITTGEAIQQSNIFWGIQFKNKKEVFTRTHSLSDPGSDGSILSPTFATSLTKEAMRGDHEIHVANAKALKGVKFIIIALFNDPRSSLLKEILDVDEFRCEWGTALRSGEECAPSWQDLVEIEDVNEAAGIVSLKYPLRRNLPMQYSPELYAVEMLENISICDLEIDCKWNGMFRHHGFPVYYAVERAKEMDYGWNGINIKRVAYASLRNLVLRNHTNPLYIQDSRNVTVEDVLICGHDGHQGIKIYEHACDNLLHRIDFRSHYADMMGGEGNAYGNVLSEITYTNPYFKPVDFDFHGFSEGPMSPPSYNLFELISGFSRIKGSGATYNQPSCARDNIWWNISGDGERKGSNLFINHPYERKSRFNKIIYAWMFALLKSAKKMDLNPFHIFKRYREEMSHKGFGGLPYHKHHLLFPSPFIKGYVSTCVSSNRSALTSNCFVAPRSLYAYQKQMRENGSQA